MGTAYKMREECPVNIPMQMMAVTDTSGIMNPLRFRLESEEHEIIAVPIKCVISKGEKNYVGIREKQYICTVEMEKKIRTVEIRYSVDTQKWRIFQFLS